MGEETCPASRNVSPGSGAPRRRRCASCRDRCGKPGPRASRSGGSGMDLVPILVVAAVLVTASWMSCELANHGRLEWLLRHEGSLEEQGVARCISRCLGLCRRPNIRLHNMSGVDLWPSATVQNDPLDALSTLGRTADPRAVPMGRRRRASRQDKEATAPPPRVAPGLAGRRAS